VFVESSFTIQFPEHLSGEKRQYCLDRLSEAGARIEKENDGVFRVVCSRPTDLARAGRTLFHSHISKICEVITVSGMAEVRAGAYSKRSKS